MCHALIIEDEALIAFHIADVAEQAGATSIAFAQTELEALSAALEHRPDIIIADGRLSTGTGPDAVSGIRLRVGRVPVVFVTGSPEMVTGYDHDGLMEKPIKEARLRQMVAQIAANC